MTARPLCVSRRITFTSRSGAGIVALFFIGAVDAAAGGNVPSGEHTPSAVESTAPLRFHIVVVAPHPYDRLLEQRLPIVRWQASDSVTAPLLERLVAEAQKSGLEALAAEGYFSASVTSRIERTNDEAVVRLNVELGPRTYVEGVDLSVAGAALDDAEGRERIEAVRRNWLLPPGKAFQDRAWVAAKNEAVTRLARTPYAAAAIAQSEARIITADQSAHLRLKLDSGPAFHAGPVNVTGLKRYPASVVLNMNPHKPGERYDAVQLALYQRRLLESGYFNAVHFAIEPDPAQAAAAPLEVAVIEAPAQRMELGLSVSSDAGFGVKADYAHADLKHRALRFRSIFDINQREQRAQVLVDTPPQTGGRWNNYWSRFERSDVERLISRELVLGYGLNWGLERVPSQMSVAAHLERQTIGGSTSRDNRAVFIGYRKPFRTTDELVSPRDGLIGSVEAGLGVPGVSTQEFARVRGLANWLVALGTQNDLLVRAEAGVVIADSRFGIPSSFLFRTGGDQSIRGYAFESIGVEQGEAIVGGRYLALASVEFTRWFTKTIGGAVFVDAGDAFDNTDEFKLAVGYGIGARYNSPIGPVRADLAYGQRAKSVRIHFSVGYSF